MTPNQVLIPDESVRVSAPAASHPRSAVSAHELTRSYGEDESRVQALRGVSLDVPSGQFAAVMGPSGSGKSTLMHILAGLDAPSSGSIAIDGQEIGSMGDQELTLLRRSKIGFIFQSFNLLPMLTAEENIVLPLSIAGRRPDRGWVENVLEMVSLTDRRSHRPAQLSGGQQQRVAIARSLVSEPAILFADEPTGNLDSQTGQEILALLREATDLHGQTTVMVTHDPRAAATADRVLYLADGCLVADLQGPSESAVLDLMKEISQ
ncbi:MAG: putative transport system ATP-binding protein [Solirubrobacteraceae bacterium]|jgi:putative ABC transport system ATP-binding protein|nr:putative transport system ATP-binding protein [Solirubrobacteraceae bacterium]